MRWSRSPRRAACALTALGGAALALTGPGCGGHAPAAKTPHAGRGQAVASIAPSLITPAHLVAVPDTKTISYKATDDDGTLRLVVHGMRLLQHPDGSIERARELLPALQTVRTLELPPRLGHGYVFYVHSSSTTLVWRANTWTGSLAPLANVDFGVSAIVAGFDRLYLVGQRGRNIVAIDADTGKVTDSGALPPSPAYGRMAIADAWTGAVEVPFRGVLASFDAGASWHQVTSQRTYDLSLIHGRISMRLSGGTYVLAPTGEFSKHDLGGDSDSMFQGAGRDPSYVNWVKPDQDSSEPQTTPPGPLGRRPLDLAVLRGFPDSKNTAVVAAGGAIGRVQLSDGKLLDVEEDAFPRGSTCDAVQLGASFGFVCGQERGSTVVYAFRPPLSLKPVLSFDEPRYVAASGNGALVIRGACTGPASGAAGSYCIRARNGTLSEVRVKGDLGVERVVALSDGRTAVIVPPRLGAHGLVVLIDGTGHATSVKIQMPKKADKPLLALLEKGLWLDGFTERKKGELAGWVAAGGPFVGVRLHLDGKLDVGKLQSDIDRSLVSGQLALSFGNSGTAAESTDGGFEWLEIELPPGGSANASSIAPARRPRGCSRVGCAFGSWLRVGWRGKAKHKSKLATAEPPPRTRLPSSGGGRWLLACSPTGEQHGERLAPRPVHKPHRRFARPPRYGVLPSPDELQSTDWDPFLGTPPPSKKSEEIGFDGGTGSATVKVHGYAWGARGASWDRVGHFLLRVADPFSTDHGIWSTALTRSPWDDMMQAATAFGLGSYSTSVNWVATLDPSGRAGAMTVTTSTGRDLYLFEEGRSITRIPATTASGVRVLAGVVKVGSTWYIGSNYGSSEFQVFRIEGNNLSLFGRYPVRSGSSSFYAVARLVRNARGDALGIWARPQSSRGSPASWFVYPINLQTRRAGAPLEFARAQLTAAPACGEDDDDGWLLEGTPPVSPYMDFSGGASSLHVRRVTARLMASARGLCIDALAADADSTMPAHLKPVSGGVAAWAAGRQTATLTVTGPGGGARFGFLCTR